MSALLAIGGSLLGGLVQSRAISSAASAQDDTSREAIDAQERAHGLARADQWEGVRKADSVLTNALGRSLNTLEGGYTISRDALNQGFTGAEAATNAAYDDQSRVFNPMIRRGRNADAVVDFNLGIGGRPDGAVDFRDSFGYRALRNEGIKAADMGAAANGTLFSGAHEKAKMGYVNALGADHYRDYMNRLQGIGGLGAQAGFAKAGAAGVRGNALANLATGQGSAMAGLAGNYASNRANMTTGIAGQRAGTFNSLGQNLSALSQGAGAARAEGLYNIGNAQSAGAIAQGNAFSSGINNALGAYMMDQYMSAPTGGYMQQ